MSSGGRREGAGRPPKENKLVQLSIYIPSAVKTRIKALALGNDITEGAVVARLIDKYEEEL